MWVSPLSYVRTTEWQFSMRGNGEVQYIPSFGSQLGFWSPIWIIFFFLLGNICNRKKYTNLSCPFLAFCNNLILGSQERPSWRLVCEIKGGMNCCFQFKINAFYCLAIQLTTKNLIRKVVQNDEIILPNFAKIWNWIDSSLVQWEKKEISTKFVQTKYSWNHRN